VNATTALGQRELALLKANEVRLANCELRRSIHAASFAVALELVADLLDQDDLTELPAGALPIRRLLLAVPKFGEQRMVRYLRTAGLFTGDRRVRDLTDRQRRVLAELLRSRA